MRVVFKTADGIYFENYEEARKHEDAIIASKRDDLRHLKVNVLPKAQRDYNTAKDNLRQLIKNRNAVIEKLSKQDFHCQLGNLEVTLGHALTHLKYSIRNYRKCKMELSALLKEE